MAGTDRSRTLLTGWPAIVLVEPQLGENIGMVARAMANFGLSELRIVRPRDGWPNEKARAAASRADHVIDAALVFDDLDAAIADLHFVLATTARKRDDFRPVRAPVEAAADLRRRTGRGEKSGILFGRERTGLLMEEVGRADEIVTFPVNPAFASLNLAQAVLLMSYEWMKSGLARETETPFEGPKQPPATKAEMEGFLAHLEAALEARGYFRPASRKPKMVDNLRAVFGRRNFTEQEVRLLRGVVASLDYYTPSEPRGRPPRQKPAESDGENHA